MPGYSSRLSLRFGYRLGGWGVYKGLGSCAPDRDFPRFLEWEDNGDLGLEKMVTERFSIDQINEATDALANGKIAGRAILEF